MPDEIGGPAQPGATAAAPERRIFLQRLSFLGGGVLLFGPACNSRGTPVPPPPKVVGPPAAPIQVSTSHRTFSNEAFATMVAVVDRLLPRDQDPGAVDANVPDYIDRVLLTPELHQMKVDTLEGLEVLEKRAVGTFGKPFPALSAEQQEALIRQFKDARKGSGEAQLYENLLTLTLEGFLGDPAYGGNKDRVGWALVGFDTWNPPDYQPLPGGNGPPGALVALKTSGGGGHMHHSMAGTHAAGANSDGGGSGTRGGP